MLTQGDPNIIRTLNLSKKQAELLGSELKGWNLLRQDSKVCFYCGHHEEFKDFFSQENGVVFCNDVSLWKFLAMIITQINGACSLIHLKFCLKVVVLHNGNRFPTVPLAHVMQPT